MIVNTTPTGWECFYQRAHAWLAYCMLTDFRPELRALHWDAVLQAALTHDHGWMEWDEAEITPDGEPCSFIDGTEEKAVKLSRRTVALANYQSPEAAVLVARHAEELYHSREEAKVVECMAEIRAERLERMARLGLGESQVEADYQQVLWADSASLILCVEDHDFVSNLRLEIDGTRYSLERDGARWTLDPWPYSSNRLVLGADSYELEKTVFRSPEELRHALKNAPPVRKTWTIEPL